MKLPPALGTLVNVAIERCGKEKVRALEDAIARAGTRADIEARCSNAEVVAWLRLLGAKIPKLDSAADAFAAGDEKQGSPGAPGSPRSGRSSRTSTAEIRAAVASALERALS